MRDARPQRRAPLCASRPREPVFRGTFRWRTTRCEPASLWGSRAIGHRQSQRLRLWLLVWRGDRLRIVPDVLSDHILHWACLTSSGQSTTYGEGVFSAFAGLCLGDVLRNLGELDWRFRVVHGRQTPVLDEFWRSWRELFLRASVGERTAMLGIMERIAPYQPEAALTLVEQC